MLTQVPLHVGPSVRGGQTDKCFLSISSVAGAGARARDTEMDQPHALPCRSPWSLEGLCKGGEGCSERDPEAKQCDCVVCYLYH